MLSDSSEFIEKTSNFEDNSHESSNESNESDCKLSSSDESYATSFSESEEDPDNIEFYDSAAIEV